MLCFPWVVISLVTSPNPIITPDTSNNTEPAAAADVVTPYSREQDLSTNLDNQEAVTTTDSPVPAATIVSSTSEKDLSTNLDNQEAVTTTDSPVPAATIVTPQSTIKSQGSSSSAKTPSPASSETFEYNVYIKDPKTGKTKEVSKKFGKTKRYKRLEERLRTLELEKKDKDATQIVRDKLKNEIDYIVRKSEKLRNKNPNANDTEIAKKVQTKRHIENVAVVAGTGAAVVAGSVAAVYSSPVVAIAGAAIGATAAMAPIVIKKLIEKEESKLRQNEWVNTKNVNHYINIRSKKTYVKTPRIKKLEELREQINTLKKTKQITTVHPDEKKLDQKIAVLKMINAKIQDKIRSKDSNKNISDEQILRELKETKITNTIFDIGMVIASTLLGLYANKINTAIKTMKIGNLLSKAKLVPNKATPNTIGNTASIVSKNADEVTKTTNNLKTLVRTIRSITKLQQKIVAKEASVNSGKVGAKVGYRKEREALKTRVSNAIKKETIG